jgi:hypothetical protein
MKPTEQPQRGQNWALSSISGYGADNRRARRLDRRQRSREAAAEVRAQLVDR